MRNIFSHRSELNGVTLKVRFGKFIFSFIIIDMASERCLAPSPDIKLCEANAKSITVDENGKSFAVILYSDFQERKYLLKDFKK